MAQAHNMPEGSTVLLVEDDIRRLPELQSTLRDLGFEVACCITGQTAITWLGQHCPLLMIVDNSLPDMTGLEFVRQIQRDFQVSIPPYILVTDTADDRMTLEAMKAEAKACVAKDSNFIEKLSIAVKRIRHSIESQEKLNRTEAELRASEERYRALFNHAPVPIWIEDFSGVKAFIDSLRSTGTTDFRQYFMDHPEDVQHCASLVRVIDVNQEALNILEVKTLDQWPEDLRRVFNEDTWPVFREELTVLAEGGLRFASDVSVNTLNNQRKILSLTLTVAPGFESTFGMVLLSFVDVTDKRTQEAKLCESERTLHAFMNAIPESAFLIDRDYNILTCNSVFAERLGLDPREVPGMKVRDVVPSDLYTTRIAQVETVFQSGQAGSFSDMRADRNMKHFMYPVEGPDNQVVSVAILGIDVTEQTRSEERLREAAIRYRIVADNTYDWEFWQNPDGPFIYVSPSCQRITGYSPDELMADAELFFRMIHPDDQEKMRKHGAMVLTEHCPDVAEEEYRVIARDGSVHWIGHLCQPVYDDQGIFLGIRGSNRDNTERHLAEEKLACSNASYRDLIENINEVVYSVDREGRILYVSPVIKNVLGFEPEELLGRTIFEIVFDKDLPIIQQAFQGILNQQHRPSEYRIRDKAGELRWVRTFSRPVIEGEKVVGFHGTLFDVTDRKRAEAERDFEFAKLNALIESSDYPIFSVDRNYCYTAFNTSHAVAMKALFGKDICLGSNLLNYHIDPAERALAKSNLDRVLNGETIYAEHDAGDDGFERRYYSILHNPIRDASGAITGVAIFAQDLSERNRMQNALRISEERFRALFESGGIGITATMGDGHVFDCNQTFIEMLGYSSEEMRDKLYTDYTHPEDIDRETPLVEDLIAGRRSYYQIEKRYIRKDGGIIWVQLNAIALHDETGACNGAVCLIVDQTERKRAEGALREKDIRLEKLSAQMPGMLYQFMMKPDGTFCVPFTTEAIRYIFGCTPDQVLNDFAPVGEVIHPDDYNRVVSSIMDSAHNLTPWECEYRVQVPGQPLRWLWGSSMPEKCDDGSIVWHGYNVDITERKAMEEALRIANDRFEMAQQAAQEGVWDWNIVTRRIEWTPKMYEIFGIDPARTEGQFAAWVDALHPEDKETAPGRIQEALADHSLLDSEYRIILPSGETRWVKAMGRGVYDANDQPERMIGVCIDITEQKLADEAVRESEHRLQQIFETNAAVKLIIDPENGRIVQANHAAAHFYGYPLDQLLTKKIQEINCLPPDEVMAEMKRAKSEDRLHFYFKHRLASGEIRDVEVYSGPFKTADKTLLHSIVIDITERKKAEEALRENEHRLQSVFETNAAVKFIIDPKDGAILQANHAAEQFYGFPPGELAKKTVFDLSCLEPDVIKVELNRRASENNVYGTFRHRLASGEIRDVEVYSSNFQSEGKTLLHSIVFDITERRKAEDALREERWRLGNIIEGTRAGTWEWNVQTGECIFNEMWAGMLGYTLEELSPVSVKTWETLTHPDDLKEAQVRLQKHFAGELPYYEAECRMRHKAGHWFWVLDRGRVITRTPDGNPQMMFGTHTDISVRKLAEEALRAREEQYRALFDSMLEGCAYCEMVFDGNGEPQDWIYLDVNSSFGRLTGLTDVIGRRVTEIIPTIREANPELFRIYGNVARTGQSTTFEIFFKPLGLWLEVSVVCPYPGHFLAVFEDVSARMLAVEALRESEQRFKQVAENAEEWIWEVDASGLYRYSSPIVEKILGYKPEELVGRKYFYDFFDADTRDSMKTAVMNAFGRRESFHHLINSNQHKNGQLVILETNAVPIVDENDELIGYRGTDQDITARQQATAALLESEERFRMLSNMAPVGIYQTDPQGKCIYANDHWCEMAGLTFEQALGDGWHQALHPDDRSKVASAWQRMIDSEGHWGLEYRFKTASGKVTWIYGYAAPMRGSDGKVFGYVGCNADITQRKQAEDALRASEDRLREIIENQGEGIGIIGGDEAFLFANPAADEIFGVPRGTLIGRDMTEFLSESELCRVKDETERRKRGEKGSYELEIKRPNGESRNILVTATPRRNKLGHVIGTFGIFRDITERKRAEMSLQKSEDRYRELYEQSPLGYQSLDYDGRLIAVNQAWLDALGYPADEVIGHWFGDFLAPHLVEAFRDRFPRFKQAGKIRTAFEMRRKDGTLVTMEFEGRIGYDPKGNFKQTHCILQDVTERKLGEEKLRASEERFRKIFEEGPLGMVITMPPSHRFAAVNGAFCKFLGYTEAELLAMSFPDVTHSDHVKPDVDSVNKLYHGELPYYSTEKRYVRKDGKIVWGQATVTVIHDSTGKVSAMLAMIEDITERRQTEEKLKASEAQLRAAQRMEAIGRLAGGVAHDFNNLLTVISGHSEITLRQLSEKDPLRPDIEEIVRTSQRAGNLTRQLLAFSRRQAVSPIVLDLNGIVENMLRMLQRIIGENISLETSYQPDLWHVKADPGQIEQVIVNLAVNARDAMPNGGMLSIETLNMVIEEEIIHGHEVILKGNYTLVSVSDTGIGMSSEVQARIFEPFFTTKPIGEGTGLGLATVYGIVKQSGGYIVVDSREGHGTTFNLYLPAVKDNLPANDAHIEQERRLTGAESIVLVDDNAAVHKLLARVLEHYGYSVTMAASAEEALTLCHAMPQPADLLISDVVLPKMNGMDLALELHALWPSTKILLMSGYTADVIPHDIADHGMTLLQKPFGPMHLVSKVRDMLDNVEQ